MKVTFGAVSQPPTKPIDVGDCFYFKGSRDRVCMRIAPRTGDRSGLIRYLVLEPGYAFNDRYEQFTMMAQEFEPITLAFDSAELIVRR